MIKTAILVAVMFSSAGWATTPTVNIALGTALPSTCVGSGLPIGGEVDVAVIVEAVNNALNGCSS